MKTFERWQMKTFEYIFLGGMVGGTGWIVFWLAGVGWFSGQ